MKTKNYPSKRNFFSEYPFLKSLFILLIFLFPFYTQANAAGAARGVAADDQSTSGCGCDITISPNPADGSAYLNGITLGVKPGYKVCIKAGHYVDINLTNFYGTKSQPVTLVNCGGLVTVSGYSSYGFIIHASRYVNISGAGDPGFKYGILIDGSVAHTNVGFSEDGQVSDISIDHFEVSRVGLGVACAPTPNCDPGSWSSNWKMYNMGFHDNYVHDTFYEGFYIGNTQNYYTMTCSGSTVTVEPQFIDTVRFYNNILDKCGWTSAQISQVSGGVDIHDNLITNFGYLNKPEHQAGLIVGGNSHGDVYRNKVLNGTGNALEYFGSGLTRIYNNIFVGAGYDGSSQGQPAVLMDDRTKPPGFPPLKVYFVNNTIVGPKRDGISFYNDHGTVDMGNIIANNIIASPGLLATQPLYAYFDLQANPHVSLSNNLTVATPVLAGLVNAAANDYHLLPNSPAIDNGMNGTPYAVTADIEGNPRPYGKAYDIGAYEYSGGVMPPLLANAGPNQTITLPVSSVTLDGSQSLDPGGTITSYGWTQLSGPSTATISNNAAVSTTASGMIQGTYIFRLTVKDNLGATATASDTIWVNPPAPPPPVANAGPDQTIALPLDSVKLDGSLSSSPNGPILSYSWTQLSGPSTALMANSSAPSTEITGLIKGKYIFNLTIQDSKAATATASVTIWVLASASQPPVADAGPNQTITLPVNSATLDGSQSFSVGGTITSYSWSEQSGPSAATITNSSASLTGITSLLQGTYVFNLIVKDNKGAADTASVSISVIAPAYQPPVADAGNDTSIAIPASVATLDGNASIGDIVSYQWVELSGPTVATIDSSGVALTGVGNLVAGEYIFQLTVTDSKGSSSQATVKIRVISTLRYTGQIILYPNPAHDVVNLRLISDSSGMVKISIYDMEGRIVLVTEIDKSKSNLDSTFYIAGFAGGTYVLQAIIGKNKALVAKFIKL